MTDVMTRDDLRRALLSTPDVKVAFRAASAGVDGMTFELRRLSVADVFADILKFPELEEWLFQQAPDGSAALPEFDADSIMTLLQRIGVRGVATVVARGIGFPGDNDVIEAVCRWSEEDRLDALMQITDISMPSGIADFFGRLWAWWARLGGRSPNKQPKAQKSDTSTPGSSRMRGSPSPSPSQDQRRTETQNLSLFPAGQDQAASPAAA